MILPGDFVRIMHPVGDEKDPSSMSIVVGDVGLVLFIKNEKNCKLPWDISDRVCFFDGDLFVGGKVRSGPVYAIKITEQSEKYF